MFHYVRFIRALKCQKFKLKSNFKAMDTDFVCIMQRLSELYKIPHYNLRSHA